jgi:nucleoside-diphosphate-sugar epimerase
MGCGWLGFPLALELMNKGYKLRGTSTTEKKIAFLKSEGIGAYQIALLPNNIEGPVDTFLSHLDILVINIPPGMRKDPSESYIGKMKLLHHRIKDHSVDYILFVSSTSVYGNASGTITEEDTPEPITDSAKHLLQSERLFIEDAQMNTTVVRFGGLIGPERHPVTMLSGRTGLTNGSEAINLIHLNDCIHLISSIIQNSWWNEIFNGVYPDHPAKADYYTQEARLRGIEIPHYTTDNKSSSSKIIKSRNFLNKRQQFYTSIRS